MSKPNRPVIIAKAYNSRGRCIAVATNSFTKTHPRQAEYGRRTGNADAIYLHAEIRALLKAREPVYRMEIFRTTADGKPALARPCAACALALKEFNVVEVIHT